MNELTKKVAYLKGLAEGYELDKSNKEHNLLLNTLDCLEAIVDEINCIYSVFESLEEYVDMVDEDLSDLEMMFEEEDSCDCHDNDLEEFNDSWLEDLDGEIDQAEEEK
ncbi:MAG: hypothetical protein MSH08_05965 [Ezakiella sp.]|nr:hypothetical protein [Ezakiella sp.]MDD7471871.1 hypothetical protein [Bacillota bacterium]MDY3923835.1 hypothetical protein [Ezakiella sp.]